MKKRMFTLFLCLILAWGLCIPGALAAGMGNFRKMQTYDGAFTDIAGTWYETNAVRAYEYGLAAGRGNGLFAGGGNVTLGEAAAMATRLYATYYGTEIDEVEGAWFDRYVSYARRVGIILHDDFIPSTDYNRAATRLELVRMVYAALPASAFAEINIVENGLIPDVDDNAAVYALYRAGVLTGYADGSFAPKNTVSRAEAFTILCRTVDTGLREHFELKMPAAKSHSFLHLTANGVIDCLLVLYPETEEFRIEFNTSTEGGAASGRYQAVQSSINFYIGQKVLGTLPGAGVSQFSCRFDAGGTSLIFAGGIGFDSDLGPVPVTRLGTLDIGDTLYAAAE